MVGVTSKKDGLDAETDSYCGKEGATEAKDDAKEEAKAVEDPLNLASPSNPRCQRCCKLKAEFVAWPSQLCVGMGTKYPFFI